MVHQYMPKKYVCLFLVLIQFCALHKLISLSLARPPCPCWNDITLLEMTFLALQNFYKY